ncbi:MAG: hypothetical protein IT276_14495 [Ignavibacteriaceae bacterium]|nr:hypothetical protein [Ignavibacterium sp.]MCC6256122.1 hypothetical protein [Ignavibacteriaceae bacterium]HRN27238.1 hypothetical protein [Ignavibacteriaceae bacterium]HRP92890.1 hypothetical protein [Ignavibacteriaceae bacterium]
MKKLVVLFTLAAIALITFNSCEPFIENKITIRNESSGRVWVNLKATIHEIASGDILVLSDFDRGKYDFETIYEIPFAVSSSSAEGDVAGVMNLIGGTEIFLMYTSAVTGTGTSSKYTIYGSMTTSDSNDRKDPFIVDPTVP